MSKNSLSGKKSEKANPKSTIELKMVRDSYTIPKVEFELIAELKQRCLVQGVEIKKSELLRAGLLCLARMDAAALLDAVANVERVKTGRPKSIID